MSEFNVYEGIMQGLNEAIQYRHGKNKEVRVRILSTVEPVPVAEYKPDDVVRLRTDLKMSQRSLATTIGVSPRTVESWEAGKSMPNSVATRMLFLIETDHSLVDRLVIR